MVGGNTVYASILSSTTKVLLQIALRFEPLAPTAINLYLNQQLHRYQSEGYFCNYKAHSTRLGKYHYKIMVDFDVTEGQAAFLMRRLAVMEQFNGVGRWFYG